LVDVTAPDGESDWLAKFGRADGAAGLDMRGQGSHTQELHHQRATSARLDQSDMTPGGEHLIVVLKPGS